MAQPFLSIVIPAYNEESRIAQTLDTVVSYVESRGYSWEVVVADDGSQDRTADLVEAFAGENPNVRLVRLSHRGKGWAVKWGMLEAQGQYRFIADADLSMPIEHLERFLPPALSDFDIAIGSREAPGSRRFHEPFRRHLMGRVFNWMVRLLAVQGLSRTPSAASSVLKHRRRKPSSLSSAPTASASMSRRCSWPRGWVCGSRRYL